MDLDFGISLDPSSVTLRHTFYDSDEEEDAEVPQAPSFSINPAQSCSVKVNVLLFAFGQAASIFVRSYFSLEQYCSIVTDSPTVFKDSYFTKEQKEGLGIAGEKCTVTSEVFKMSTKSANDGLFFACVHEKALKLENVNYWTAKVLESFTATTVLVLCSLPLHRHLSLCHSDEEQVFLRALQSSKWTQPALAAFLEPANSLSEEPASVLTHCQVHNIAGAIAVQYSSSCVVLTEAVAALRPLLTHPLLADSLKINCEADACRLVKDHLPKPKDELSSLYT